jgi:hypothetical protein
VLATASLEGHGMSRETNVKRPLRVSRVGVALKSATMA